MMRRMDQIVSIPSSEPLCVTLDRLTSWRLPYQIPTTLRNTSVLILRGRVKFHLHPFAVNEMNIVDIVGTYQHVISQLQEQVNLIAHLTFNTIGALQRDAPPNRLSPNYPEPPAHPTEEEGTNFSEQPKLMSSTLVKAAKQFDSLVAVLPISESGEEEQLKRITELQTENDAIGQELQKQLEAAEKELNLVQELFRQASNNCLNLKKPDDN
ncbi:mediator of RNA polymerase II transcription subunit 21-like isoform X2 [Vigna angularis]|uniref:mediator of RNA polymerase II transcription subunit 21-like isoform X2 n=1 Tax=Phaseolus angularis TaxID=3914 RepID=UPI0022B52F9A|nr:mediator of RNA polymerase II transcription subunit 21-like isoform X2 [Vigna angularis]